MQCDTRCAVLHVGQTNRIKFYNSHARTQSCSLVYTCSEHVTFRSCERGHEQRVKGHWKSVSAPVPVRWRLMGTDVDMALTNAYINWQYIFELNNKLIELTIIKNSNSIKLTFNSRNSSAFESHPRMQPGPSCGGRVIKVTVGKWWISSFSTRTITCKIGTAPRSSDHGSSPYHGENQGCTSRYHEPKTTHLRPSLRCLISASIHQQTTRSKWPLTSNQSGHYEHEQRT